MRLNQLKYFMKTVELGSISAAARAVNLAQPAFSNHIRSLEKDLGVVLFDRSVKGVTLTPAGRRLHERGNSILRRIDQVRREVTETGETPTGDVSIAISPSMARLLSGRVFWAVLRRYPDINLKIHGARRVRSGDLVNTGNVDFAMLSGVISSTDVRTEPFISQRFCLIGAAFPDDMGETVDLADLRRFPLAVGNRRDQIRVELENAALREG